MNWKRTGLLTVALVLLHWLPIFGADAGPTLMPPHPDLYDVPGGAAAVARVETLATGGGLWQAGLNDPAAFDMRAHLARPKGFVDRALGLFGADPSPDFRVLVICVDYDDDTARTAASVIDSLVYGLAGKTVRTYYRDNSGGRIDVVTVDPPSATGWARAPQKRTYYTAGNYGFGGYPQNAQRMAEDAMTLAAAAGVDLMDYDNDGNGRPDGIVITHAGSGAELTGDPWAIWSHKWVTRTSPLGVPVEYATMPELWSITRPMTIGVYCHELGHVMGLPDLYDGDGSSHGIGKWGLMAQGSWNGSLGDTPAGLCAWSRLKLGLADCVDAVPTTDSTYTLEPLQLTNRMVRIWASGAPGKWYWLLSHRGTGVYDEPLPGTAGVMVEACDDGRTGNNREWCRHDVDHLGWPIVRIVAADDRCDLEKRVNPGDPTDLWQPGQACAPPLTDWYSGDATGVTVTMEHATTTAAHVRVNSCLCPHHGVVPTLNDIVAVLFMGALDPHAPTCPVSDYDLNCDGNVDSVDLNAYIDHYFFGLGTICTACSGG